MRVIKAAFFCGCWDTKKRGKEEKEILEKSVENTLLKRFSPCAFNKGVKEKEKNKN